MDTFLTRKRKHEGEPSVRQPQQDDEESTEYKIAILSSLHPHKSQELLFDCLLAHNGSLDEAIGALEDATPTVSPRKTSAIGYQSSLASFVGHDDAANVKKAKILTKRGVTLHLYSPQDIEKHTPCSIIHNFLPTANAEALLNELLAEVKHFKRETFQMFERTVESPHTYAFYVDSLKEVDEQQTEYVYNGSHIPDVRQTPPEMLRVSSMVQQAVNTEIKRRMAVFQDGQKLKFQAPGEWLPNASFVNCYDGGKESVGYHSDQLTYLGPRAIIGSLSLGVEREFRVRKIVPSGDKSTADTQGQIAIHLPHNSLLVMHAEMQEEWKHAIAPAQAIDPHPTALNKRINVTYRCYQPYLHPRFTPKCKCNVPCVLRCVQRQQTTRGRYMWMCHANYTPGQKGCSFFEWAKLDVDGRPPWAEGYLGNANAEAATDRFVNA